MRKHCVAKAGTVESCGSVDVIIKYPLLRLVLLVAIFLETKTPSVHVNTLYATDGYNWCFDELKDRESLQLTLAFQRPAWIVLRTIIYHHAHVLQKREPLRPVISSALRNDYTMEQLSTSPR